MSKSYYKLSATNRIQVWTIGGDINTQTITIYYGQDGGLMQEQVVHVNTNQSGRSMKEQMLLEMKSRISKQLAQGYRLSKEEAFEYKNKNELNLQKPMLAQRHDKVSTPQNVLENYFRQHKYDGHRCLITYSRGEIIAYSRNGKVIDTLEHITEGMEIFDGATIDGEIYCHGESLQTISSWCKRKQENTKRLRLTVYDMIISEPYEERLRQLRLLHKHGLLGEHTDIAETWQSDTPVLLDLNSAIDKGYEGLILRNPDSIYDSGKRSKHLIKVKKSLDDEFLVTDVTPSADGWGVLQCVTSSGKPFRVSAPGTIQEKIDILNNKEKYIGNHIRVEFFSETADGIPFHPVATYWRNKHDE